VSGIWREDQATKTSSKQQKRHPSNRNVILAKAGISSGKESSSEEKSHPRGSGDLTKAAVI
jgi:hypothetical protein